MREVRDVSDTPLRQGSTYRERAKPGPREGSYDWRVEEWEEPRRQVHSHASFEMEARLTCLLEESDGGTRYRQVMSYRMLPKLRPLGWVLERAFIQRKMHSDMERFLANAKRIIEGAQGEEPPDEEQLSEVRPGDEPPGEEPPGEEQP